MTQADFTIANQTFPNTRAEINTSLQALATNSAGNSAPSTTHESQWWFDSDGNQLYIRNKDNDAWVKVVTIGATSDKIESIADNISIASTGGVTITTADNTDTLTLISTDADANAAPNLRLFRNSSSPADGDDIGKITFSAENDASEEIDYITIRGDLLDVTDGTEDGILKIAGLIGGAVKEFARFGDGVGVVFNEESNAANDFRVESDAETHALFVDASTNTVGIGVSNPTTRLQVHCEAGDAFGAAYFESHSAHAAMLQLNNIRSDDGAEISLHFLRAGANQGAIGTTSNGINFWSGSSLTERFRVHGDGTLSTGGETVTDVNIGGLTIQMNANDGGFFSAKSSDIAHGITGSAETDTFVKFSKHSATNGGISILALTEGTECIKLNANPTSAVTSQNTSSVGSHTLSVSKKSGTGTGGFDGTGNIVSIANHTTTRFHFRGDGNFYADAGSNTFDEFEDAHLVRAYDLSHGKGVINSKFDEYVKYNHEKLAELDLVGREKNGEPNHFINVTGMQRLHNGAIWQQYEKTERLANAMYELAKVAVGEDKANEILEQNEIKLLN